jgi:C_GCAxxG_C_C family probable redox protein
VEIMPSKLSNTAKKLMFENQLNCAQAVFSTYCGQLGVGKVDYDTCLKIASTFGGGIAQTGNVCGALTGALMTLGLKYGSEKWEEVNQMASNLLDGFKSRNGSVICRELIDHDLLTDEDLKQAFETGAFKNCPKFVEDASILLEKLLSASETT